MSLNLQKYKIPRSGEALNIYNNPNTSYKFLIIFLDITECASDPNPIPLDSPVTLNLNFTPPDGFILKVQIASAETDAIIMNINTSILLTINYCSGSSSFIPIQILSADKTPGNNCVFTYFNNVWAYTDSEELIQNVLTNLARGDVPSNENPLSTSNTVGGIIKDILSQYLDTDSSTSSTRKFVNSRALPYSEPVPNTLSSGLISTLRGLPNDLYNVLDVASNPNINDPVKNKLGDNRLITTEFNDYLNYFITELKENPDFISSVANQIVTQCNLNDIVLEIGSIITLTYPKFLRQSSPYLSFIIPANSVESNISIDSIVLNTGSQITFLGSNIVPVSIQSLIITYGGVAYYNESFSTGPLVPPYAPPYIYTFTISTSSTDDFNFSNGVSLRGIYMIDINGKFVKNTQTSLANNTITYTLLSDDTNGMPIPLVNLPYFVYILYDDKIYYNGEVGIYINQGIPPAILPPAPAPTPYLGSYEFSIFGNIISDNLQNSVINNDLTVTSNTLINFTITSCDAIFSTMYNNIYVYTFQLAILNSGKLTTITDITPYTIDSTLNTANFVLYGYDKLPINPNSPYELVAIITQFNLPNSTYPNGYYTSVYTSNPVNLTVIASDNEPTPLISFVSNDSKYLFPLYDLVAVQGDTINFYIYSRKKFIKNVIYFNGQELTAYTKTDSNNTYSGGSTSYINYNMTLENELYPLYIYYVAIPIKLTLPASLPTSVFPPTLDAIGTRYYITVATTILDDDEKAYSTYYSTEQLTLHLQLRTKLTAHGYLVNGIVTPSVINNGIKNFAAKDVNAFATINGLISPPDNSLFYYKTSDNNYSGYFYVKTSNTIVHETPSPSESLYCFQGQGYGTIVTPIAPISYHTIINNMLHYFIKMAIQYGFVFKSEIEAYENNNFNQEYLNIQNLINYIELSTRNTYLCGKYTTNVYIVGNSIPVGTSYYPNDVKYQSPTGSIPDKPNPDINGLVGGVTGATGGISSLYYNGSNGSNGPYWGVTGDMSLIGDTDQITTPTNWTSDPPTLPKLPLTTTANNFKGYNSITALNATLLKYSQQLNYCSKNIIIIPEDYVGYGLINGANTGACSQPDYILTIHLNTYGIYDSTANGSNGCTNTQSTLNGSIISPGSEINIINNSPNAIVKVISYNLATNPPTPLIINLGNTTMDSLYIKATDSMHLIFGGSTWGIL